MKSLLFQQSTEQQHRGPVVALPNTKRRIVAAILSVAFLTLFIGLHLNVYSIQQPISISTTTNTVATNYIGVKLNDGRQILKPDINVTFFKSIPTVSSSAVYNRKIHFSKTNRRLPQTLIIGVRKCGTRALLEMLFLHPHVQKAAGEVHFFDRDENYSKGLEWYRKKMPYSFNNQVTIEKSPSYFVTPEVPERVRAMNSSIKLLLILREPVTRAISDYTQLRSHAIAAASSTSSSVTNSSTQQHHKTFEQLALKADGRVNSNYRPIIISTYHNFVHHWLDIFAREQILIVNGDQLIEDPVPVVQKIESFLGLEPQIGRRNFYFNRTKGFYCMRNDYNERCLRDSKGRKHPKVNKSVIVKLRQFFSEHNQKLYELIGEDLKWPEN